MSRAWEPGETEILDYKDEIMSNKELIQKAILAGFDANFCARITASDGKEAVQLPKDTDALDRLEQSVSTLKSAGDEFFHYWLVRA